MSVLNSKMDDILACKGLDQTGSREELCDTLNVFEQLVEYFQNVAAKLREFSERYAHLRRRAIERTRRGNYD